MENLNQRMHIFLIHLICFVFYMLAMTNIMNPEFNYDDHSKIYAWKKCFLKDDLAAGVPKKFISHNKNLIAANCILKGSAISLGCY